MAGSRRYDRTETLCRGVVHRPHTEKNFHSGRQALRNSQRSSAVDLLASQSWPMGRLEETHSHLEDMVGALAPRQISRSFIGSCLSRSGFHDCGAQHASNQISINLALQLGLGLWLPWIPLSVILWSADLKSLTNWELLEK